MTYLQSKPIVTHPMANVNNNNPLMSPGEGNAEAEQVELLDTNKMVEVVRRIESGTAKVADALVDIRE